MSKPRVAQRRATFKRPPKAWALLSVALIGAAFALMLLRILNTSYRFDGLFFLGFIVFIAGIICIGLQMEATERWEARQ